jgi:hypothetical protein
MASGALALQAIIEPDDASFAAPGDMPQAIADYCRKTGQTPPDSVGATVRCCLESLALKYRWTFERLEELRGAPLDVLHIVGGGTQNKLLSRLTADCLQKPVITGPVEATSLGNILTQAMGSGHLGGVADIRAVVRRSFEMETFEPDSTGKRRVGRGLREVSPVRAVTSTRSTQRAASWIRLAASGSVYELIHWTCHVANAGSRWGRASGCAVIRSLAAVRSSTSDFPKRGSSDSRCRACAA